MIHRRPEVNFIQFFLFEKKLVSGRSGWFFRFQEDQVNSSIFKHIMLIFWISFVFSSFCSFFRGICLISNFYFSIIWFKANFKMIYTVNQLVGILLRHAVLSLTHLFISSLPYPSFSGIRHKNLMLISLFLSANKLIYRKSLNLNPNNFICYDNVNRSFKYLM